MSQQLLPCVSPPLLLDISDSALSAVRPGGVVLALADEEVRVGVRRRADVGVAVAHAATADTDLFYGVVVLEVVKNGLIINIFH